MELSALLRALRGASWVRAAASRLRAMPNGWQQSTQDARRGRVFEYIRLNVDTPATTRAWCVVLGAVWRRACAASGRLWQSASLRLCCCATSWRAWRGTRTSTTTRYACCSLARPAALAAQSACVSRAALWPPCHKRRSFPSLAAPTRPSASQLRQCLLSASTRCGCVA